MRFFRQLGELLWQSVRTLWAHKLRSFLTMFGIAWGVGSLLLLIGLGEGFRSGNRRQLDRFGEDVMFIGGMRLPVAQGPHSQMRYFFLKYEDFVAIRDQARLVRGITAFIHRSNLRAVSAHAATSGFVQGAMPNMNKVRKIGIEKGRWLNDYDDDQRRRVAVVGADIAQTLFPDLDPLGKEFLLNGNKFQVVGLLVNDSREGDQDTRVFIPFQTMQRLFPLTWANDPNAISQINYQPRTREEHQLAKEEVHKILAMRRGIDPNAAGVFDEWDTIESANTIGKVFDAMNYFLGSVGLVTLALGAIGIINIMLVSVAERTYEIGLRKALGATKRQILTQFFLEGAFLTIVAGGIGVAGAAGFMGALAQLPSAPGFDPPKIVPTSAALAIACLSLAAMVAGLYPATKAAELSPTEALRRE